MALTNPVTPQDVVRLRQAIQQLSHLRLGPTGSPQFAGIEVGHLTDTTLTRASAGDVNIEGNIVYRAGGTDVPVTDGGTGVSSLTDHGILLGSGTSSITPLGVAGDGYLPIGKAGNDPVLATITGTAKRVIVTNGAGSITLSGPQDLDTVDSPTFAGLTLTEDGANITLKNDVNEHGDGEAETLIKFTDHTDAILGQIEASHSGAADDTKGNLIFSTHNGTSLTEIMRISDTGFIGVGITPLASFHIAGSDRISRIMADAFSDNAAHYPSLTFRRSNNDTIGTATTTIDGMELGSIDFQAVDSEGDMVYCGKIKLSQVGDATADNVPSRMTLESSSDTGLNTSQLVLDIDGNVGLGTNNPGTLLQLVSAASYITLQNTTDEHGEYQAESRIIFEDHADNALVSIRGSHSGVADDTKGEFGIAVNDGSGLGRVATFDYTGYFGLGLELASRRPGTMFQMAGPNAYFTLQNNTAENGEGEAETRIIFEDHADNALAQIQGSHAGTDNDNKGDLIFYTNDGTSLDEAMRIGDNGFLGIGIQSPLGPLHTLRAATSNRIIVDTYSDNVAHYSNVQFRRSNNDTPGTMTATIDTMIIGTVEFRGTDTGLGYDECARIEVIQDGNAGADDIPANMIFSTNSTTAKNENQLVLHNDGLVGIGLVAPTAQLHIDQSDAAGAIPVLKLDQADIDDSFIDFIGTSAGDGTRSISSDVGELGACFGKIRVEINGVTKWIRVYDDST